MAGTMLFLILLPGCGRFFKGVAAAAAGEAAYEGTVMLAKNLHDRSKWKADLEHPTASGIVSTATFQVWIPKPGLKWTDTQTTEPRRFQ